MRLYHVLANNIVDKTTANRSLLFCYKLIHIFGYNKK